MSTCITQFDISLTELPVTMALSTELKTSTAVVPPASTIPPVARKGSNSADIMPPPDAAVKLQANKAFDEDHDGDVKKGTAHQRMTYAVMCHHSRLIVTNSYQIVLSDTLTSTADAKAVNETMVEHFVGEKPEYDKDAGMSEKDLKKLQDYNNKAQLVKRGVTLGAMLMRAGVTFQAFNLVKGMFATPPSVLMPKNAWGIGRMANKEPILLDNRPIVFMRKNAQDNEATVNAKASVAQVQKMQKPAPKPRPTKGKVAAKDEAGKLVQATFKKPQDLADAFQPEMLIAAVKILLVDNAPADKMRKADMPKGFNDLSAIMRAFDEARNAPTWDMPIEGKPAPKAKGKAA